MSEYKEFASTYDNQVREYDSYGHDVLFGMSFEFVKSDEKLLDIGIGTGLASIKFSRLGLQVYGLDSSQDMLHACQSKAFTRALHLYDMTGDKIPYANNYFHHVICCGAMHFIGGLESLFHEIRRVMKSGGIFSFTIAPNSSDVHYSKEDTAWGIPIFKHSITYILKLLGENDFELQKEQRLLIKGADKVNHDMLFSALVVKCQ